MLNPENPLVGAPALLGTCGVGGDPTDGDRAPTVTWLGHSTALIDLDGVRILTDPVLRKSVGPLRRYRPVPPNATWDRLDAVVISHPHWDHLDLPSLRLLPADIPVIVPRGAAKLLQRAGLTNVEEMCAGQAVQLNAVEIRATPAMHSGFRPPFGPTAGALGYLISGSGSVYFAGDTDLFPEMVELRGGVDLALLPIGGWGPTLRGGHLDPVRAAASLALIEPSVAFPIHWGTLRPLGLRWLPPDCDEPARRFVHDAAQEAPGVIVRVATMGKRQAFTGEQLA